MQVMQEEYGLYVWPCSVVLAEYIWQNRQRFVGSRVIEVGINLQLASSQSASSTQNFAALYVLREFSACSLFWSRQQAVVAR